MKNDEGPHQNFRIRKAVPQDIPRILELYEELTENKQDISPDTVQRVFAEIAAMPDHEFLIAEINGLAVGSIYLQIVPNLSHGAHPWAEVENLIVDGRYRRQGIGRLLLEYAVKRSREAGCYKVQLLSNKKRHEAHQFYHAMGFEDFALGLRLYL
jgi:predicted N-acetyltransferase YhbS